MNFVGSFGFDYILFVRILLRVPNDRSVFFFDPVENVRDIHAPTSVWKNRVGESELGQRDFAAAKQGRRIRAQAGTNSRRSTKLQNFVETGVHSDPDGGAVL